MESKTEDLDKIVSEISNYLFMGGMFNPELAEHHKVSDLLMRCRDQLSKMKERDTLQRTILKKALGDKWFTTGEYGERDNNGLPKYISVCPCYGVDFSVLYEKTDKVIGGMGS